MREITSSDINQNQIFFVIDKQEKTPKYTITARTSRYFSFDKNQLKCSCKNDIFEGFFLDKPYDYHFEMSDIGKLYNQARRACTITRNEGVLVKFNFIGDPSPYKFLLKLRCVKCGNILHKPTLGKMMPEFYICRLLKRPK